MRKNHLLDFSFHNLNFSLLEYLFSREIMIPVLFLLLTAVACRTTENPLGKHQHDPSLDCPWVKINHFIIFEFIWLFSVPDLRNDCIENCENEMIECFYGCNNDSACLWECLRGETHCINCKLQVHPYCLVEFRVFVCGRFFTSKSELTQWMPLILRISQFRFHSLGIRFWNFHDFFLLIGWHS